MNKVLR